MTEMMAITELMQIIKRKKNLIKIRLEIRNLMRRDKNKI